MNFIRRFFKQQERIEELEEEVSGLQIHVDRLRKDNRDLMSENERLEKDNSNLESEIKRLESRRAGLADANIRKELKIKQLEERNEYLQRLNAMYAADRQAMMAEPGGPDQAARKFPRVTAFLNRTNKEDKGI